MNRAKYNLLVFAIAIAVISSCDKQDIDKVAGDGENRNLIISAQKSADTKTSIADNIFTWVANDSLSLYAISNGISCGNLFTISEGQGTRSASFKGSLDAVTEYIYAIYPYSISNNFQNEYCTSAFMEMNQVQRHTGADDLIDSESIGEYTYMYGKSKEQVTTSMDNTTTDVANVSISMKQLTAIIDVKLSGVPADTKVNYLSLRTSSKMVPTVVKIAYESDVRSYDENEKEDYITVTLKDKDGNIGVKAIDGNLTIRLAILPTDVPADATFRITLNTTNGDGNAVIKTHLKTFGSAKPLIEGIAYAMNLDFINDVDFALVQGEDTQYEAYCYPSIEVSENYLIYIYDRNAGVSVPKNSEVGAGGALNWVNPSSGYLEFKGDYYNWHEAQIGMNTNGTAMCPNGWRLPNAEEVETFQGGGYMSYNSNRVVLTGGNGIPCFFPLSGSLKNPNEMLGRYRSSTDDGLAEEAKYLQVRTTASSVYLSGKELGFSVRCVKTV